MPVFRANRGRKLPDLPGIKLVGADRADLRPRSDGDGTESIFVQTSQHFHFTAARDTEQGGSPCADRLAGFDTALQDIAGIGCDDIEAGVAGAQFAELCLRHADAGDRSIACGRQTIDIRL